MLLKLTSEIPAQASPLGLHQRSTPVLTKNELRFRTMSKISEHSDDLRNEAFGPAKKSSEVLLVE
jgi:hypothetical protein